MLIPGQPLPLMGIRYRDVDTSQPSWKVSTDSVCPILGARTPLTLLGGLPADRTGNNNSGNTHGVRIGMDCVSRCQASKKLTVLEHAEDSKRSRLLSCQLSAEEYVREGYVYLER